MTLTSSQPSATAVSAPAAGEAAASTLSKTPAAGMAASGLPLTAQVVEAMHLRLSGAAQAAPSTPSDNMEIWSALWGTRSVPLFGVLGETPANALQTKGISNRKPSRFRHQKWPQQGPA